VTWNLSSFVLLGLLLGIFGVLGFKRGIRRELIGLVGIIVAILIVSQSLPSLKPKINQMYRMARLAWNIGVQKQDPGQAWAEASQQPDIIQSSDEERALAILLFVLITALGYLLAQRYVPEPHTLWLRFLGLLGGLFNGFWIAMYALPLVFPEPTTTITVPSGEVRAALSNEYIIARVIAVFVFVIIALGIYSASNRGGQK